MSPLNGPRGEEVVRRNAWLRSLGERDKKPVGPSASRRGGRDHRLRRLEAVLFLAREPLTTRKLSQYANLADGTEARTLLRRLNDLYDKRGRSFRVERVSGGYQLMTRPQFANWARRLEHVPHETRLSAPALETLAVVAYRQPVLRADIEAIRGVSCGEILRQLMERDLVRIGGRSEELGRPFLYATTKRFLRLFGLDSLEGLPGTTRLGSTGTPETAAAGGPVAVSDRESATLPNEEEPSMPQLCLSDVEREITDRPLPLTAADNQRLLRAFEDEDDEYEEFFDDEEDEEDDLEEEPAEIEEEELDEEELEEDEELEDEDEFEDEEFEEEEEEEEFEEEELDEDEDFDEDEEDEDWEEVDDEDEDWEDEDDEDWDDEDEEEEEEEEDWE